MLRSKIYQAVLAGLTLSFLAACAPPSVETSILMPANQAGMAGVKRIGVTPLKGDRDGLYTSRLQAHLANIQVEGATHFTLVDIDRETIMREQKMSDTAFFNAETAAELGQLVAADTIFSGQVTQPRYEKTRSVQERKKCVQGQKSEYGDTYVTCEKYKSYVVPCISQSMRFAMNLRATNVSKGTIGFIQDYEHTASHFYCTDNGVAQAKDALSRSAVDNVLAQIRMDVAPYPVSFTISYLDYDARGALGKKTLFFDGQAAASSAFESGLKLAGKGNNAAACEQFAKAASAFNGSPAILHNMGVCAETAGNLDKAIAFYEKAALVASEPIDVISSSLARAKRNRGTSAKVQAQLR